MNALRTELIERIQALTLQSYTVRQIVAEVGVAKNTVEKYRAALKPHELNCGCGRPLTHGGWCRVRYQRSPKRMQYWESRFIEEPLKTPKQYDDQPGYFGSN